MTTMDTPGFRDFIAMKLHSKLTARKGTHAQPRTWMQSISRLMFHIAGFSCLTVAGFSWSITVGWIIAGLSSLAMSSLMTNGGGSNVNRQNPNPGDHLSRR